MGKKLWFSRVLDIGMSNPRENGRPVSQLIDYTICASFFLTDQAVVALWTQPWTEQVNRRGRRGRSVQLIVRCRNLPQQFKAAGGTEEFRREVLRVIENR